MLRADLATDRSNRHGRRCGRFADATRGRPISGILHTPARSEQRRGLLRDVYKISPCRAPLASILCRAAAKYATRTGSSHFRSDREDFTSWRSDLRVSNYLYREKTRPALTDVKKSVGRDRSIQEDRRIATMMPRRESVLIQAATWAVSRDGRSKLCSASSAGTGLPNRNS